jgi:hypothetical protein
MRTERAKETFRDLHWLSWIIKKNVEYDEFLIPWFNVYKNNSLFKTKEEFKLGLIEYAEGIVSDWTDLSFEELFLDEQNNRGLIEENFSDLLQDPTKLPNWEYFYTDVDWVVKTVSNFVKKTIN